MQRFRDARLRDPISTAARRLDCRDVDLFICTIAPNKYMNTVEAVFEERPKLTPG
jgi:hypothetical protein